MSSFAIAGETGRNPKAVPDIAADHRAPWFLPLLFAIAVALLARAIGPWYPGDAPDYARFIAAAEPRPLNSGHLIWIPLARAVMAGLRGLGLQVDPLSLIQWMSALFTMGTVFGTWVLAGRLGLRPRQAWVTLLVLGGFAVTLLTGGAGGAIAPMVTATVAATLLVSGPRPWTWGRGVLAAGCMVFAWSIWGIAVFLVPVLGVAAYWNDIGTRQRRSVRACVLMGLAGFGSLGLAAAVWASAVSSSGESFSGWLVAASHGVAKEPSILQFVRGCYGSLRALVAPSELGVSLKSMLLNQQVGALAGRVLFLVLLVALVAAVAALALAGLFRLARGMSASLALKVSSLALAAWLPSFLFAATIYGGSELHMVAGAAPFVALAFSVGITVWRPVWATALVVLIWSANLGGSIIPMAARGGPLGARLGSTARQHLPAGSAIVFFGQDITHSEGQIPFYRDTIHVLNIGTDVADGGVEGWDVRLQGALDDVVRAGGRVAVLSDLLERPTEGGIKVNQLEFPRPSMADVHHFFRSWREGASFKVDRYTFVILSPVEQSVP